MRMRSPHGPRPGPPAAARTAAAPGGVAAARAPWPAAAPDGLCALCGGRGAARGHWRWRRRPDRAKWPDRAVPRRAGRGAPIRAARGTGGDR